MFRTGLCLGVDMKALHFTFLLLLSMGSQAQPREKSVQTDSGQVVLHFFADREISTKQWTDLDKRWGRSLAYDQNGKEIFNYQTRSIGGHASVYFSYHPNGGVSKIEVSNAPDAGIQWYRSTATYDETGNRTGFTEEGNDNYGPITGPGHVQTRVTHQPIMTEPPKQEVVECQKMFLNEVFLVNATRKAGKASVKALKPSPALKDSEHTLAPGDTLHLGSYSMGETFTAPDQELTVVVNRALRNRKKPAAAGLLRVDSVNVSAEHRRYYVVVRGWK